MLDITSNNLSLNTNLELIAQDCRELLCNFSNVSIKFISRVLNVDAHNVTSLAKFVGSRSWLGIAPLVSNFSSIITSVHGCVSNWLNEICLTSKQKKRIVLLGPIHVWHRLPNDKSVLRASDEL
jgi:hypothetical protein